MVKEALSCVDESTQGVHGSLENLEMAFVLVEDWDEEDDKFGANKVVEEGVLGKREKGIWKQVGKRGHLKFRDEQ